MIPPPFFLTASQSIHLASAGEIGGMMGKKLGLGWSRALPVIRQKEDIVILNPPLSCCLTPCRPPGHWAEPGIARKLVVTRRRKLPSFPSGQNPDLLTRLLTHSSEEIEISHRARRGKMTKTC